MPPLEVVYLRTKAGRLHKGAILDGRRLVDEACNLDDTAGDVEVLDRIPEDLEPDAFCGRCFTETEA